MVTPRRGDIWMVRFNPVEGHEAGDTPSGAPHPAVIISTNYLNEGHAGLVIVVPITSKNKGIEIHVELKPGVDGVKIPCWAKPEHIRSVSKTRLSKRLGVISEAALKRLREELRDIMELDL